ncbi:hypothetical protein COT78_00585 [Candidatus Berkelbacteria bacterium CG10_big_fil_rev_8_21_14_0_10_43_13]|uniref:Nucleotidyl transferase AbiEii/AbiGii toxin family protein n=1 Tax=Candidatus Berkelbacteria bacterium CG10_big_fil_rev_8_21_14_0_10_43_13 TaxID=1974514 RepID=A0A2H0W797_9BACT|nr:MAG: hypothetical protein COT78_00585 [Candidatus Berkelbacteria bacterium CG10_big_fil_rev_8_21_14_0_10_43_13]
MDKQFHWEILDQKRLDLLPLFKPFKDDFYLAGGTALALQIGHRDSIDFDFFSSRSFSTEELFHKVEQVFADHRIVKTQEEKDTLTLVVDENIKLSFFSYPYRLVEPLLDENNFNMASVGEVGAMKLSAITSRSVLKDYVDLYFILHDISLENLFEIATEKFPTINTNTILKSLVYFDDIEIEPILFKSDEIDLETIKKYLADTVKKYLAAG